jgi:cytochrome c oxidase cbb3-type subunit 1
VVQGLMWRTYTESGTLSYSFVDSLVAMHSYYIARAFGGLLFLLGALTALYNVVMTIRMPVTADDNAVQDIPAQPALVAGE